jgi:hypothetical protein
VTSIGDAGETVNSDEPLQTLIRGFQSQANPREFFVARLECASALPHAIFKIFPNAGEFRFQLVVLLSCFVDLACAFGEASL